MIGQNMRKYFYTRTV